MQKLFIGFFAAMVISALPLLAWQLAVKSARAAIEPAISDLIEEGNFAEAEKRLARQITDPSAPITSEAAIQLEILRRIRRDFPYNAAEVLQRIKQSIPDVTQADINRWRELGDLQARMIDGEHRYFREAVGNLFRFSDDARKRQAAQAPPSARFDVVKHVEKLVELADESDGPAIYPVKHVIRYELAVNKNHPRLKSGAQVRAWLPFPQEYRDQQKNVKLIRTKPAHTSVTENGAFHRAVYFEDTIQDSGEPPKFVAEFEFVTSAYVPELDPAKVTPYDASSAVYRENTAERPPHIVFSAEVKKLAKDIVGDETNPLEKARKIFRWVSANIPWCSEMEYSIIPNISAKALHARRGDCGVQGLTFITLCRAAGVPARWQSGWQTKPGNWNMHDWSEIYIEPWGWLPVDASNGVLKHSDARVRDFFCGHMDPYRMIVNLDYARELTPPKTSYRSEPNDFQRGEVEIDGHNLYFDEWDWTFDVKTTPLDE